MSTRGHEAQAKHHEFDGCPTSLATRELASRTSPSRSYPWSVEGANVEDPEEASALQRNMLPEYVPDHVTLETCSVCEEATGDVHSMALQCPYEAASEALSVTMNNFIDAEVATTTTQHFREGLGAHGTPAATTAGVCGALMFAAI
ncbi:hypothetical protein E4U59_005325 [Claviceps monticola]|nr:hypothetical protein E4U59_005325 [Claviceps monticola]